MSKKYDLPFGFSLSFFLKKKKKVWYMYKIRHNERKTDRKANTLCETEKKLTHMKKMAIYICQLY